ncbi:MAG: helix-hairpin-helix domain-containing protein [Trueperaceae bacterium]
MFTRKDVAAQLGEAARLLDVLGEDPFRARAFQTAARAFESYGGDVTALHREGRFTEVRGVGAGTAAELQVMFESGVLPTLADLRSRVPDEVKEMFAVSGLGAKRIGNLWRSGVAGVDGLLEAAESGRLAAMPGFGAKSAAKILESARFAIESRARMRLDEADRLAEAILAAVISEFPAARAAVAGEHRRGLETVAGIELVLTGIDAAELADLAARLLDAVDAESPDGAVLGTLMGRRIGFRPTAPGAFGAVLALRTGSEEFAAEIALRAEFEGVDLHDRAALESLDFEEEADFLVWLGLPAAPPELRETRRPDPVPELLELGEVRGLVHNHSTWSDGALSLREMLDMARRFGFAYLAMADHSQSSAVANGLSEERVKAQSGEVLSLRAELASEGSAFELLHGIEVDIRGDGTLDYPDEVLSRLDYVVASVHQNFGLTRDEQTERIVRAVANPHVNILGHATGRLLLRRPGYDVDLERVIAACAETGTVIEINANPRRLDLDWRWVIRAKELGCTFSIDPDAHSGDGFDDLRYGVTMARKAGLTAADVVNTAASGAEFLVRLGRY